jgi:hypothetical protein
MSKKHLFRIFLLAVIALLILGNPSERTYLKRIAEDYGDLHGGMEFSEDMLTSLGSSDYHSYVFYGTYTYAFGNISVTYGGVAFFTFYLGSSVNTDLIPGQEKPLTS